MLLFCEDEQLPGLISAILNDADLPVAVLSGYPEAFVTLRTSNPCDAAIIDLPYHAGDAEIGPMIDQLRAARPDVSVLLMSGCMDGGSCVHSSRERVWFIQKPFKPAELIRIVNQMIGGTPEA